MLVTDIDSACLLQIDDKDGGFCLKRGNEYYLVLGTAKSYDCASAGILVIEQDDRPKKINGETV
jgi:hypothetical protein